MPPELLTSLQNPLIKKFRAASRGRKGDSFLLEGRHLLQEALNASWPIEAVLLDAARWSEWASRLDDLTSEGRVFLSSASLMDRVARAASPEGVLVLARRRPQSWPNSGPEDLFLFLDGVQDPVNVGILIRSARAFGLAAVFAGTGTADPYHPTVLARSAGAALHLPIISCSGASFIDWASANGVHLAGTNARGTPLHKHQGLRKPAALVMGNEGRGLSPELTAACPVRYSIPMASGWDSLNVAVAGALFMYTYSLLSKAGSSGV
jgi:TrmH family RNA methyltransferase